MASFKEQIKNEPSVASLPHVDTHINEFKKGVYRVTDGVYIAIGYAAANSICVETRTGLVIIDVLEDVNTAREICKEFKRLTGNKPIKSIIFTHAHFDHVAGIKGFIENEKEGSFVIYLHNDCLQHQQRNVMFKYGIGPRSVRQFGVILSHQLPYKNDKNWFKNIGLGPSLNVGSVLDENGNVINDFQHSVANSKWFKTFGDQYSFCQDGVRFDMTAAFGETDDQILIHVPSKSLLLPGDNIYRAFPNIYAIRGVEPRNAYSWYQSIEKMLEYVEKYNIQHLAPSHSQHVVGYNNIVDTLGVYRDGIAFVHDQTIRFLNQGFSQNEIIQKIQESKSKTLFQNAYLLEFYGTIEWSVRAVFMKNMGWFSGKIDDLFPASKVVKSEGMTKMMQYITAHREEMDKFSVEQKMIKYVEICNEEKKRNNLFNLSRDETNRWILELTTQIMIRLQLDQSSDSGQHLKERVADVRYDVIRDLASYQTSGAARNYLLTYWLEEKYDLEYKGGRANFSDIIMGRPIHWSIKTLPFHVDPVKCEQNLDGMITGIIELCDIGEIYRLRLKEVGVMQLSVMAGYDVNDASIDWILQTNEKLLKYILTDEPKETEIEGKKEIKSGHLIPRVRTVSGALIAVFFGMVSNQKDAKKNGLIKGHSEAVEFFSCLEFNVISKL